MKTYAIAEGRYINIIRSDNEEVLNEHLVNTIHLELDSSKTHLTYRYSLVDGEIKDMYPSLSDEDLELKIIEDNTKAADAQKLLAKTEFQISINGFKEWLGVERRVAIRGLVTNNDAYAIDFTERMAGVQGFSSTDKDLVATLDYFSKLKTVPACLKNIKADFYETGYLFK